MKRIWQYMRCLDARAYWRCAMRQAQGCRCLLHPFLIAAWIGLVPAAAQATLHEVVVLTQAEAPTREEAKQQAVKLAKGMAVARVARKLNPGKAQAFLDKLDLKSMEPMIRGVSVVEEARVEKIYYAKVKVSVLDTAMLAAFGTPGEVKLPEGERQRRSILVLPVYYDGKEPVVWDAKLNPTYSLWRQAGFTVGKGVLLVPNGDPKERAIVDRDNVLKVKYEALKPLLESYGTDELAIVVLSDASGGKATEPVEVITRRVTEDGSQIDRFQMTPLELDKGKREARTDLYERAVQKAASQLFGVTETTAYLDAKKRAAAKQQSVMVQFTTLRDWAGIEKRLRAVPGFVAMEISSIGINHANLTLFSTDDIEKVRKSLVDSGLIVADVAGVWRIRSR